MNRWVTRLVAYAALLFVAAVAVAVFTPTTDAITMLIPWLALSALLCGLFELGWWLARRNQ